MGLAPQVRQSLARDVFEAMPMLLRLLRKSFLLPKVGQPLLDIMVVGFQALGTDKEADVPILCFRTWKQLAELFQVIDVTNNEGDLTGSCSAPIL